MTTTQEAIESIEDVVKWGVRHIPSANPAHQTILRIACSVMELCLKFRINKEDVLTIGEMVARVTRSIVFKGIPEDEVYHLDDLTTVLARIHTYLEEIFEATKGWNVLMDKTQRESMAKAIATQITLYQDDIRRTASFLDVDLDIQIVGSVDDLMQDMQAMMDKLGKMDHYISLARSDGTLNRQVDNLLEMAIQLQRGLDHYHKNVNLRNVKTSPNFEASVLASFDKVIHAVKDSWRASKIAHDLPLDEMLEEWMLASEDVVYDPNNKSTFLGQGASAMVYLGQYKGRSVAVKHFHTLKLADSTEFETMIRKEIKAWRDVSNERYILTLIGVCTKIASPIVVCEYCPDTITRYIRLHPEKLIEMVYQFALGLLSLHNAGIIHRDIKGGNVLVREDGTVAIADFGLSRSTESLLTQYSNVGRFVGTLNWMSPEQRFSPRKVTVQSDVWSFGMTVWQLVARDIPYRDYCQEEIEEAIQSENNRPGRPEELAKDYESLWDLITWCWKLNPLERPESRDIVSFLEERYGEKLNTPRKVKNMEEPATADTIESEDDAESLDVKINIEYRGNHNATPFELKAFVQNIQLMSQFDSPFIVQFVGAAWTGPEDLMCVMEWMDGGDLRGKMSATTSETFSWRAKYEIIYHIVEGLVHLHSMNVIHRDVKSRNIMLDSSKPAKLMDVSTSKDHIEVTMTFAVGTFRWMAPEVILDQAYTASADIYSFGTILLDLIQS
ncbi:unnamed protein product [Aphanomyces euteiches]